MGWDPGVNLESLLSHFTSFCVPVWLRGRPLHKARVHGKDRKKRCDKGRGAFRGRVKGLLFFDQGAVLKNFIP